MPCTPSQVAELITFARERILSSLFPHGRSCFGGAYFVASSPLAKRVDDESLRVNKSGTWSDLKTGRHGDDLVSLYGYARAITPAQATVQLAKILDPSDRFLNRPVRAAEFLNRTDSDVMPRDNDLNKVLAKHHLTPRQRAEALLQAAMNDRHSQFDKS